HGGLLAHTGPEPMSAFVPLLGAKRTSSKPRSASSTHCVLAIPLSAGAYRVYVTILCIGSMLHPFGRDHVGGFSLTRRSMRDGGLKRTRPTQSIFLILRSPQKRASRRIAAASWPSWFETREVALLTMRVSHLLRRELPGRRWRVDE